MKRLARYVCLILVAAVFAGSVFNSQPVLAQSTQTSYTVNLTYLSVVLSYPSEVKPGDSVTVNLQASAKSSIDSVSLTAQVFYADGINLRQLASATVSNNYYTSSGSSLSKRIQFTVPQDAPRTSLIAVLTEKVQTPYYSYYYYPAYYNYSSPYCYNYPNWYDYYYDYCTYYGYAFPSYSYSTATDNGVAPLSYIKATTPEYVSLQSQYQTAQQQLNQSQAENQQLKQNLQNAQNTIAQRDATIASLNQQLSSSQSMIGTLEAIAAALVIIAIACVVFIAYLHRGRNRTQVEAKADREKK